MKTNKDIVNESLMDILSGQYCLSNNTKNHTQMNNDIDNCKLILIRAIELLKDKDISNFILNNYELLELVNEMNDILKELIKPNN